MRGRETCLSAVRTFYTTPASHLGSFFMSTFPEYNEKSEIEEMELYPDLRSQCYYCGTEIYANAHPDSPRRIESDHYISKANGGSDKRENKVGSCVPCNRRKGKLNGDKFLKIIREEQSLEEPRNYTMPDNFMSDQKVPARWRLLGVINGFHIAGLPFYGSNEWLKAKLNCSEQTITNAVKELEDLGEVYCQRTSTSRHIFRTVDPSQLGSRPKPVRVSDPSQLGTNSVSNSDSKVTRSQSSRAPSKFKTYNEHEHADDGQTIQVDPDFEETVDKPKNYRKDYEGMIKWLENETGVKILNRAKQYTALKKARVNSISRARLKDRFKELREEPYFKSKGKSPDWANVISSFDNKA